MNYQETLRYLESLIGVPKKGHGKVSKVLRQLRNPHKRLQIIHVAGTNGKGSTCIMLHEILRAQGYNVGLFTSPHMEKYNERFRINGQWISDEVFVDEIAKVKEAVEKIDASKAGALSFFEMMTVVAFDYFDTAGVDFVLLETGLGGRADATNVVPHPLLTIITAIDLDHTEQLGETIEAIAQEKAGIMKKKCPLVLYSQKEEVYNIITQVAKKRQSPLYDLQAGLSIDILHATLSETCIHIAHPYFQYRDLTIKLLGEYQIYNTATVLLAVAVLQSYGVLIAPMAVRQGIQQAQWPGRMELIQYQGQTVLLEGAHNFDAMVQLQKSVAQYFPQKTIVVVLGVLADKDYEKMAALVAQFGDIIILTKPDNKRAKAPMQLKSYFPKEKSVLVIDDPKEAVQKACALAPKEALICVTGSLYLVGAIGTWLGKEEVFQVEF